ncbi:hypothetical protein BDY17DRAFT_75611 [Neohortaea acidophila]|uniref:Uncharacterized protein n=1 Tax=Neohortaea acidophila TaxID=245834 RepID=A0A6A6Q1R7_9PEZI|nr:uncharacterized protein BDY17DRAFT_75611 [Neohortaea acidophila]KAF2486340.1 hypothetical protein BDY17DRAFT_75611 [Neohortaea acidophila]
MHITYSECCSSFSREQSRDSAFLRRDAPTSSIDHIDGRGREDRGVRKRKFACLDRVSISFSFIQVLTWDNITAQAREDLNWNSIPLLEATRRIKRHATGEVQRQSMNHMPPLGSLYIVFYYATLQTYSLQPTRASRASACSAAMPSRVSALRQQSMKS